MRRLFSTFASGAPGVGLLLLRLVGGGALLVHAVLTIGMVEGIVGALLLLGLWTPVTGVLAALTAAWIGFSHAGEPAFWLLAATLGIALALLGPGAWSLDARLFGWKRVDIRNGNGHGPRPD